MSESVTQLTKGMPDILMSPVNRERIMKPVFGGFAATQPLNMAQIKAGDSDEENIEATEDNRDSDIACSLETRKPVAMNGALQSNREKGKINFLQTQKYKASNVFNFDEVKSPSGRGVSGQGKIKCPKTNDSHRAVVESSIEQARKAAK